MDWLKQTKRHKFENGLTLLTHVLPHSEAAALHFTVQAGYFCETDPEVGLAHLLEHMYFKGSAKFTDPGSMGIRMKAMGGSINASTSYDQTCYFCEVPAENLEPAIDLMGDAFVAPLFPADELTRETEVVIEEFNRKLDSPAAYSQEQLIQMAYSRHRMKRWRIGTPDQLRSYTRDHLFDYFHRYYVPQNMVVVISGKFDEAKIVRKIQNQFAGMQTRELKKDFGPVEPPQNETRYALKKGNATQSYLHLAFHSPGVTHADAPALDFLSFLLSTGRSSRLHRYLVEEKRSASSIWFSNLAYENVGLLLGGAVCEAADIRAAGQDFWNAISDFLQTGIGQDELQKVKSKLKLQQVMQTEEALELAQLLGYFEAYGDFADLGKHWEQMQQLEDGQIREVASKYLRMENMSVLEFVNNDLAPLDAEQYRAHLKQQSGAPSPAPALPSFPEISAGEAKTSISKPIIQGGKITYIFQPDPHQPFIAGGVYFTGGRSEENAAIGGLTHLLFRTILKGTSDLNAEQIAFQFDSLGNPPRFACYRDYSGFSFEALPEQFVPMWNLLIHCLTSSSFPEAEVKTEIGKMAAAIKRNADDNFTRPLQLFLQAFYGDHPYGIPEVGFEESISRLVTQDLVNWKARLMNCSRMIVTVAGNFNPATLVPILEKSLKAFPLTGPEESALAAVTSPSMPGKSEERAKKQTAFVLGYPAPVASDPDIHKYEVLQQVLSGMGGRLFINLRSKKSLAYTVYAGVASSLYSGTFLAYIAGDASKETQALQAMKEELERLKKEPVTPEELENAKNALIGAYALGTQAASARVLDYVNSWMLDRPIPFAPEYRERIRAVTADDIVQVAQRAFLPELSTMGIVRGTTSGTQAEKDLGL